MTTQLHSLPQAIAQTQPITQNSSPSGILTGDIALSQGWQNLYEQQSLFSSVFTDFNQLLLNIKLKEFVLTYDTFSDAKIMWYNPFTVRWVQSSVLILPTLMYNMLFNQEQKNTSFVMLFDGNTTYITQYHELSFSVNTRSNQATGSLMNFSAQIIEYVPTSYASKKINAILNPDLRTALQGNIMNATFVTSYASIDALVFTQSEVFTQLSIYFELQFDTSKLTYETITEFKKRYAEFLTYDHSYLYGLLFSLNNEARTYFEVLETAITRLKILSSGYSLLVLFFLILVLQRKLSALFSQQARDKRVLEKWGVRPSRLNLFFDAERVVIFISSLSLGLLAASVFVFSFLRLSLLRYGLYSPATTVSALEYKSIIFTFFQLSLVLLSIIMLSVLIYSLLPNRLKTQEYVVTVYYGIFSITSYLMYKMLFYVLTQFTSSFLLIQVKLVMNFLDYLLYGFLVTFVLAFLKHPIVFLLDRMFKLVFTHKKPFQTLFLELIPKTLKQNWSFLLTSFLFLLVLVNSNIIPYVAYTHEEDFYHYSFGGDALLIPNNPYSPVNTSQIYDSLGEINDVTSVALIQHYYFKTTMTMNILVLDLDQQDYWIKFDTVTGGNISALISLLRVKQNATGVSQSLLQSQGFKQGVYVSSSTLLLDFEGYRVLLNHSFTFSSFPLMNYLLDPRIQDIQGEDVSPYFLIMLSDAFTTFNSTLWNHGVPVLHAHDYFLLQTTNIYVQQENLEKYLHYTYPYDYVMLFPDYFARSSDPVFLASLKLFLFFMLLSLLYLFYVLLEIARIMNDQSFFYSVLRNMGFSKKQIQTQITLNRVFSFTILFTLLSLAMSSLLPKSFTWYQIRTRTQVMQVILYNQWAFAFMFLLMILILTVGSSFSKLNRYNRDTGVFLRSNEMKTKM